MRSRHSLSLALASCNLQELIIKKVRFAAAAMDSEESYSPS